MNTVIHRAEERGKGEHGWLSTRYSFSFADWYEPERMGFGALRVLNDDTIAPASGFGMHPHHDMEIVTIPTAGAVTHKDSMGNKGTVPAGDIQVMSAGRGVVHSEYNESDTEPLTLFQIWIETSLPNATPRYAQGSFPNAAKAGELELLVAPLETGEGLGIYQDAYIYRGSVTKAAPIRYLFRGSGHGAYLFVIEGNIVVGAETLRARDAIGVWDTDALELASEGGATFLIIEVPME